MADELSAKELRDLADAVDAANAMAAGQIEYIDEPAELPSPPESEPMVMRACAFPSASTSRCEQPRPRPACRSPR